MKWAARQSENSLTLGQIFNILEASETIQDKPRDESDYPQFILNIIAQELRIWHENLEKIGSKNKNEEESEDWEDSGSSESITSEESEDWEGSGKLDQILSILNYNLQQGNLQPLLEFFSEGIPRVRFISDPRFIQKYLD